MVSTFRIVLKQDDGFDVHDTREFDLALDSKFAIGRASKNASKGYLLPAKHNVYIDSPVVSREHAILTANATTGTPGVFITDTKSMHGTFVNDIPLVPHTPRRLSNGDKLQFGVNVNRNDSYFVAYKYTYNAELSNHEHFSRGFTVPEAESEEDELAFGFDPSGCGSQLNPLVLDDSDPESEHAEHAEHSEDNGDVTMALFEEGEEAIEIDNSSEAEDDVDLVVEDMTESDVESDAGSTGSATGLCTDSPVDPEALFIEEELEEVAATGQVQATPADQARSSATTSVSQSRVASAPEEPFIADVQYPASSNFSFPPIEVTDQDFASIPFESTSAPPLPPRPLQKRQRIWDDGPEGDFSQSWLTGEPSTTPLYASASLKEYTYLAHNTAVDPSQQFVSPAEYASDSVLAADRILTPPPTLDTDVVSATPPTRRTRVSITEIVDEQPPTPTSVNSRKRSAHDAFDEEAEHSDKEVTTVSPEIAEATIESTAAGTAAAVEVAVLPSVEQVTPQSQRPIAQPRSILRKALRAATLMVPATAFGAAVSIAALTALPESFFTVA